MPYPQTGRVMQSWDEGSPHQGVITCVTLIAYFLGSHVNVRVCVSAGIVFLIEFCLPHWSLPGGRCRRDFRLEHRLARIRPFSNQLACETDVFLRGSLARQKEVSMWILLNWFDLNHHFHGVFPLLEHLRVHLFCFSFHVEECIIGQCTHFTPNTCAN